jgi:hypothetical protein
VLADHLNRRPRTRWDQTEERAVAEENSLLVAGSGGGVSGMRGSGGGIPGCGRDESILLCPGSGERNGTLLACFILSPGRLGIYTSSTVGFFGCFLPKT